MQLEARATLVSGSARRVAAKARSEREPSEFARRWCAIARVATMLGGSATQAVLAAAAAGALGGLAFLLGKRWA